MGRNKDDMSPAEWAEWRFVLGHTVAVKPTNHAVTNCKNIHSQIFAKKLLNKLNLMPVFFSQFLVPITLIRWNASVSEIESNIFNCFIM